MSDLSRGRKREASLLLTALTVIGLMLAAQTVQGQQAGFNGPPLSGAITDALSSLNEVPGIGVITNLSCTDGTDLGDGNIRINCDSTQLPHNETTIAVDPVDPM